MLEKRKAPWVFGEVVEIDEDDAHEFKMHRSICLEEVSTYHEARSRSKIVRTKQPASKTLCAFLNSSQGGQLFLGINDDGRVVGMKMTDDQCDHLLLSLHDTLQRFLPPVPPERISVQFLTISESTEHSTTEISALNNSAERRSHRLRTSDCWCEREAASLIRNESYWPLCLVVIAVAPWVTPKGEHSIDGLLQPIFQNEEGLCYKRRAASNTNWSVDAIRQVTEDIVTTYYQEQEERLDEQIVGANSRFNWCSQM